MARHFSIALLASLGAQVYAAEPLSYQDAIDERSRLQKLHTFSMDMDSIIANTYFTNCMANSWKFRQQCTGYDAASCIKYKCTVPAANQTDCLANGGSWNQDGYKKTVCCNEDKVECQYDEHGNDYKDGCCDMCTYWGNTSLWTATCDPKAYEGASVCGTTASTCYTCRGNPYITDQGTCENSGTCSLSGSFPSSSSCTSASVCTNGQYLDETSCVTNSHNWTAGVWTAYAWAQNITATTERACKMYDACGYCSVNPSSTDYNSCASQGTCSISSHMSASSCTNAGGSWTAGHWNWFPTAKTEEICQSIFNYKWVKRSKYNGGSTIPHAPMAKTSCSTGPSHEGLGRHFDTKACINQAQFLQDAQNGTAQEAWDASYDYYYRNIRRIFIAGAHVINAPTAVDPAWFYVGAYSCFFILSRPYNEGELIVEGGNASHFLIINPINTMKAKSIDISGGSASILGGTNDGKINMTSPMRMEVFGVTNSGPIYAARSQDIFIANVENSGNITITDVSATLINVTNIGMVTVHAPVGLPQGSKYALYDMVNHGNVTVHYGMIDAHMICPSSGTVILMEGVVGNLTYQSGCMGTIYAPAGVIVSQSNIDLVVTTTTTSSTSTSLATTTHSSTISTAVSSTTNASSTTQTASTSTTKMTSTITTLMTSTTTTTTTTIKTISTTKAPSQLGTTILNMEVTISDPTTFNIPAAQSSLANHAGVPLANVAVSASYKVAVTYTLTVSVSNSNATAAIAAANNVNSNAVTVQTSTSRRLTGSRRLASVNVQANITSQDATAAKQILNNSMDASKVQTQLASINIVTNVVVQSAPVAKIALTTVVTSSTAAPVSVPIDPTSLQTLSSAFGGNVTVLGVAQNAGSSFSTTMKAPAVSSAMFGSHLPLAVVGLVMMKFC